MRLFFTQIKNPSYLNSLYAGIVLPIIMLPKLLWLNTIRPTLSLFWALIKLFGAAWLGYATTTFLTPTIIEQMNRGAESSSDDDQSEDHY